MKYSFTTRSGRLTVLHADSDQHADERYRKEYLNPKDPVKSVEWFDDKRRDWTPVSLLV